MDLAHEDERLRRHFADVLGELRERPVERLDRTTRARRAAVIELLAAYRARGLFPRNRSSPERARPTFVDDAGTRCAVAHLMDATGASALVDAIAHDRNHARVRELAADAHVGPGVGAWLAAVGLTEAEAARIQPEYCFITAAACVCGFGQTAYVEAQVTARDEAQQRDTLRVTLAEGATDLHVGDSVVVPGNLSVGVRVVVATDASGPIAVFPINGGQARLSCNFNVASFDTDDIRAGWLASDCQATLVARDPAMERSVCDDGATSGDDGGCASGGLGLAPGAVLAAWLLRRQRARP